MRVCDKSTAAGGEERVSPSRGDVSPGRRNRKEECEKRKDIKLWVTDPKALLVGVWGCQEFAHIPPPKTSQEVFLPHLSPPASSFAGGLSPQQVPSLAGLSSCSGNPELAVGRRFFFWTRTVV